MAGRRFGKYEILEKIGEGTNAVVYKARNITLDRIEALKVIRPGLLWKPESIARFMREAKVAAQLDHPNIVTIYEVGEVEGSYYIAMKYIEGRTVEELIERGSPLLLEEALNIACQVADALAYAHERGFIHRDVKPSNIIVTPDGKAVLTDFGLARALEWASLTGSKGPLGTPGYIPPEIWEGKKATLAADVYSFGVILWEILAGRRLFDGETPAVVMRKHLMEEPPHLSEVREGIPEWLEEAVGKALVKEPDGRYRDMGEMEKTLRTERKEKDTQQPAISPDKAKKLFKWIKPIIAEILDVNEREIALESRLREDLGADELDEVELIMAFEDEFGIQFSIKEELGIVTVKDVIMTLLRKL
jgi:serine/threonine-protein kinase